MSNIDETWIDELNPTKEEKENLKKWIEIFGHSRYKDFYFDLKKLIGSHITINYSILKNLIRYYFNLTDISFSLLKFVERRFQGIILDNSKIDNEEKNLNHENYIYFVNEALSLNSQDKENLVDSSLFFEKNKKYNFKNYIQSLSINELIKILTKVPEQVLKKYNIQKNDFKDDLELIKDFRNHVSHCHSLIQFPTDKNTLYSTFKTLFKYTGSESINVRRKEELSDQFKDYIKPIGNEKLIEFLKSKKLIPFYSYK